MMAKKRISLRIDDGEIAVVGPVAKWTHLILLYETMAEQYPEDQAQWLDAAEWIREYLNKSGVMEDEYEEV